MDAPVRRLIRDRGTRYTVRNADRDTTRGARDTPSYQDAGTIVGVLQRGDPRPDVSVDSDGTEIEGELQLRCVDPAGVREAGNADGYPTRVRHPDGRTYRVVASYLEDSGVTVLSLERA
jgi:hypothetical protein